MIVVDGMAFTYYQNICNYQEDRSVIIGRAIVINQRTKSSDAIVLQKTWLR